MMPSLKMTGSLEVRSTTVEEYPISHIPPSKTAAILPLKKAYTSFPVVKGRELDKLAEVPTIGAPTFSINFKAISQEGILTPTLSFFETKEETVFLINAPLKL